MPNIRVIGSANNAALILEWVDPVTGVTKTALVLKHELTETRNPTVLDDGTEGFERGSYWFNATTLTAFICLNPATGAAQWRQMAGGGGGTGTSVGIVVEVSSNIVIDGSGALPTIDGYAVQDDDRVLLTDQTNAVENGLWIAHTIGTAWVRPTDFATADHAGGRIVFVVKGAAFPDTLWACITDPPNDVIDTNNLAFEQIGKRAEVQIIYVGKHGSDSNAGKSIEDAMLTFGAAITAAGTPADEAAAVTVVCFDDGEYDEDLTCVNYVNIYAPSAALKGKHTLKTMYLTVRRMINDGDNKIILKAAAGTSYVTAEVIYSTATTNDIVEQSTGDLKLCVGRIETTVQSVVSLLSGGAATLDIEAQEIIGVISCLHVGASGGVVTARVGRMSGGIGIWETGTDEVDAVIGRLDCTTAYNINATSALRLLVGELSGTETAADGADVRVTRARRDNFVATTDPGVADDDTDGYTVGSTWINVSTDEAFVCVDASTGAAVWLNVTGGVDQVQVLYVGKHGNDSYSGKTPDQAKLTFAAAITAAGTPANEAAAVTVVCLDDGEYDEDLTCVNYVNIYAPSATLKGKHTLKTMHLTVRRMINDGDNEVVVKVGAGTSYVTAEAIHSTATTKAAVAQTEGDLKLRVGEIQSTVAKTVSLAAAGALMLDLEAQEFISAAQCLLIAAVGGVVVMRVGRMTGVTGIDMDGTDKVDAVIGRLACTTAYNINATSALRLLVGELFGTETAADGADVRVSRAERNNYVATTDPGVADDNTDGYTVGSTWINVSTDEAFVCVDASTGAAIWLNVTGGVDQVQVLYVGKHGNDSYSGKTPDQAKLTFGAAITAAGTPANEAAAITVVCLDDSEYDEDLTCVNYVNIYAPNVTLKGKQTLATMHLTARRMINDGEYAVISKAAVGMSYATVESIYSTATMYPAVYQNAGDLKLCVDRIEATAESSISLSGAGVMMLDVEAQELIGSKYCLSVSGVGGVVTARVGRMSGVGVGIYLNGTDEVDAVVGRLDCTTAYNINATSALRLIVGELSGTETAADGADVRVTRARRDNFVATTDPGVADDDTDGYTVGSTWINVTTDETFVCTDASTGAAIWKHVVTEVKNEATTNDATVTTLATIPIPDDTVVLVEARIVARRTNAADRGIWIRRAAVFREAAGAATMVSFVDTPFSRESDPLWNGTIDVNGNNARILVTGRVGHDINWKSLYTVKEVG